MTEKHDTYEEMVVGYAFDALEPDEERAFQQHLEGCAECAKELAEARRVAGQLAYLAPSEAPPAALRSALLATVGEEAARAASTRSVTGPAEPGLAAVLAPVLSPARGRTWGGVRSVRLARPARALGIAAAVAALVAGGSWAESIRTPDSHIATQLASEFASRGAALQAINHPGSRRVELVSAGAATATAVIDGRHVWLIVDGLARNNPQSSIYVLWAARADGAMQAVTGFDVAGSGMTLVNAGLLPDNLTQTQAFAVSHEAGHTIPAAPSQPVLGTRTN